uniref:Transcriptional protein SWT1 n=1 Tax=Sphenodon punctatus TaxID=8508 RepID=A0A8D0GEM2_SPHPU
MPKKKWKKSGQKEDPLDRKTSTNKNEPSRLTTSLSSTERIKWKPIDEVIFKQNTEEKPESQRSEADNDIQEKKRKTRSGLPQDAAKGEQKETSNDDKSLNAPLIPAEQQKKITFQIKHKGAKHGGEKSNKYSRETLTSVESHTKKLYHDTDTGKKRELHISGILKDKGMKKKKELRKLTERVEKTMLEKFKAATFPTDCSYFLGMKSHGSEELNDAFRISKPSCAALLKTVGEDVFTSPKSSTSRTSTGKEHLKSFRGASELSSKKHKDTIITPSRYSTEKPKRWEYHREREQHPHSSKTTRCSRTEKDNEAKSFHSRPSSKIQCPSTSHQATENADTDQEMQIIEDLHAARIEKKMALPVVQSCGELTSMEIDLSEDNANVSAEISSDLNMLIVIDTNIMISHLQFIKTLKNAEIPGIGKLSLIIPWVVLQELDNLKKGKILEHIRHKVIPAVHFIYTCLKNQDPNLWGQSMQLAAQKIYGMSHENNDDRVLQCCLQYQNLFPQTAIILCTDDKNLCNKALVSEVKALSKADLVIELQKLSVNGSEKTKENDPESNAPLPSIFPDLEKCLGEALSSILETEMKIAFENLWMEVLYLKPPWTLADLLQCFKKHWMAVFGQIVSRDLLSTVESLYERLCKGGTIEFLAADIVLQEAKVLLHAFSLRSDYGSVLTQAYAQVNKLLQTLKEGGSDCRQNSSENSTSLSENTMCEKMEAVTSPLQMGEQNKSLSDTQQVQNNRQQEIWSVLESVWNTIYLYSTEVFQKLDPNAITTTPKKSLEEAFLGLQKLMVAVNDILAGIRRILAPNSSFQDIWTLYNFLTNNEINTSIKFTAEELYECVSQEMYRERLSVGCCQLAQLEDTIKQCNTSIHMEAKNRGWL